MSGEGVGGEDEWEERVWEERVWEESVWEERMSGHSLHSLQPKQHLRYNVTRFIV